MNTIIRKLLRAVALLTLIAVPAFGQGTSKTVSVSLAAATATTVLSNAPYVITGVYFYNTNSTLGTVWLYDSTAGATNYVQPAYTSYSQVSTNWSSVFTNATGIVITNTFTGISNVGTSVSAATNELPKRLNFVVPGTTARTLTPVIQTARGATFMSTSGGVLELTYTSVQ